MQTLAVACVAKDIWNWASFIASVNKYNCFQGRRMHKNMTLEAIVFEALDMTNDDASCTVSIWSYDRAGYS